MAIGGLIGVMHGTTHKAREVAIVTAILVLYVDVQMAIRFIHLDSDAA